MRLQGPLHLLQGCQNHLRRRIGVNLIRVVLVSVHSSTPNSTTTFRNRHWNLLHELFIHLHLTGSADEAWHATVHHCRNNCRAIRRRLAASTGEDPSISNSSSSCSSSNNNNNNNTSSSSSKGQNAKPKQTQRKCVSENNSTASSGTAVATTGVTGEDGGGGGVNNLCNATTATAEKDCLRPLVLALGDCFPVRPWSDSPIACLAELRMVWKDRNEQCLLIALRLFFLPENTPAGRNCHGEQQQINDGVLFTTQCLCQAQQLL
ncbi:hypothetical protein pipiens_015120 [Culex pipiens pipiens]|uniref:Uncharacterized protein n=1 Tax=Culex pipiens pipiens TaxID=38569 RepID=A0ABD1CSB0_CULPP